MQTITDYPSDYRMRTHGIGAGGKKPGRLLLILCSLLMPLMASSLALAASSNEELIRLRVDELVDCLVGTLSIESELELTVFLTTLSKKDVAQTSEDCTHKRVSAYDARDFASYAMGVSLQRKLLKQHETLNWVDFINGLLRAESSTVRASNAQITSVLKETLLGDAEASQQYLERLAESEDVEEVSGVFFRKLLQPAKSSDVKTTHDAGGSVGETLAGNMQASIWDRAFNQEGLCDDIRKTESRQRLVRFHLVKPINQVIEREDIVNTDVDCIAFQVDDVIRGWRLVVDELDEGEIYDVLIPSELAYGTTGVPGMVESDENLRFLMQVELQ